MSEHLNGQVLRLRAFFSSLCSVLFVFGSIILCKADLFKVNCPRFRWQRLQRIQGAACGNPVSWGDDKMWQMYANVPQIHTDSRIAWVHLFLLLKRAFSKTIGSILPVLSAVGDIKWCLLVYTVYRLWYLIENSSNLVDLIDWWTFLLMLLFAMLNLSGITSTACNSECWTGVILGKYWQMLIALDDF